MMTDFTWKNHIRIDKSWHSNILNHQFTQTDGKIEVCLHSVDATGTQIILDSLIRGLARLVPAYVLSEAEIGKSNDPMEISHRSISYFGDVNPDKDGKYGELLLFGLVESMLECKMVAHKVKALSSMNDQVKGGDGVFLGQYSNSKGERIEAFLVGESKVYKDRGQGINDGLKSINRMHAKETAQKFREAEWFVASNHLLSDSSIDIDSLYDTLNPDGAKFKGLTPVHPILIMYDDATIPQYQNGSKSKEHLEELLAKYFASQNEIIAMAIKKQIEKYPELGAPYFHFFLIPVADVSVFRNGMYRRLHNTDYKPQPENDGRRNSTRKPSK